MVTENLKRLGKLFWDKGLVHVLLALIAGMWVVTFSAVNMALPLHGALTWMSLMTLGKTVGSLGFTWGICHALGKSMPIKPVKLFWLYFVVFWVLSTGGVL